MKFKNDLEEIIQPYLKYNFDKVLKKYKSSSQGIYNCLDNNPNMQHYELMLGKFHHGGFGVSKVEKDTAFDWYMKASKKK